MKEIEFLITADFKKDYKRLSKKYPSLDDDLQNTRDILRSNPEYGVLLSGGFRKVRMSIG